MKKSRVAVLIVCVTLGIAISGSTQSNNMKEEPATGIKAEQKAPAFVLKDQFGQAQSNETLKGANGTVLLFVRSADW